MKTFRDQANTIASKELEKALREIRKGEDPEAVVASLSRALTNKLIHPPTSAIRNAAADGRSDLLEYLKTLYQLD